MWKLSHTCINMVAAELSFSAKDSLQIPATGGHISIPHLYTPWGGQRVKTTPPFFIHSRLEIPIQSF